MVLIAWILTERVFQQRASVSSSLFFSTEMCVFEETPENLSHSCLQCAFLILIFWAFPLCKAVVILMERQSVCAGEIHYWEKKTKNTWILSSDYGIHKKKSVSTYQVLYLWCTYTNITNKCWFITKFGLLFEFLHLVTHAHAQMCSCSCNYDSQTVNTA